METASRRARRQAPIGARVGRERPAAETQLGAELRVLITTADIGRSTLAEQTLQDELSRARSSCRIRPTGTHMRRLTREPIIDEVTRITRLQRFYSRANSNLLAFSENCLRLL